jgi:hypothetical protein
MPRPRAAFAATLLALTVSLLLASTAGAAAPDFLLRMPDMQGEPGSGAGQLAFPRAIAGDPSTGHVYVSNSGNYRIDEYTSWGSFVKAWGWDVAPDGAPGDTAADQFEICTTVCQAGSEGNGAGQFRALRGITLDGNGDVYVFDAAEEGSRVQKFDPAGNFLLMWGGDVVAHGPDDSANDEQQEITIAASGGSFKLSFKDPIGKGEAAQTPALPYEATAAEMKAALDALPTVDGHGGSVTVTGGPGGPTGANPYLVSFEGDLGGDDVPQLTIDRKGLTPPPTGARLVCSTTTTAETTEYQWLRNALPIAGATASTYTTTAADEGAAIQCQVFTIDAGGGSTQVANPAHAALPEPSIAPPIAPNELERPNGNFLRPGAGGSPLICNAAESSWKGASSFSYRWYRNGVLVTGATESTYVTTNADLATPAAFQCEVTATNAGGTATGVVSRSRLTEPAPKAVPGGGGAPQVTMEPIRTLTDGGAAEVCKAAGGDFCKGANAGAASGQFNINSVGNYIAYDPAAHTIFTGDKGRIDEFNPDGSFKSQIPFTGALAGFDDEAVAALVADPSGDLYFALENTEDVYKTSAEGEPLAPGKPGESVFKVGNPLAVAAGVGGHVYAIDDPEAVSPGLEARVLEFDASGKKLLPTKAEEEEAKKGKEAALFPYVPFLGPQLNGLATNLCAGSEAPGNLYVVSQNSPRASYVDAYGTPPIGCEPPPPNPPRIEAQYATAVGTVDATLKAQISPLFWDDTTYWVQYGVGKCSDGGCAEEQPAAPGSKLTAKVTNAAITTAGVFLAGLEPGTIYHYRFVAQSSGGGPVFGVGDGGEEGTFTTFALPGAAQPCPINEAFRGGLSAHLPDCRAYEIVSPLQKENGDAGLLPTAKARFEFNQSAFSGERFTYTSLTAFDAPESAPYVSQYLANRYSAGGWSSKSISPPHSARALGGLRSLNNEFKGFSDDLCEAWLRHNAVSTLAEGAIAGYANLYRRKNCAATPSYEALSTVKPPSQPAAEYELTSEGASTDGTKTAFMAGDKLTGDAPSVSLSEMLLYMHSPNGLHYVCYLPNGHPNTTACGAGLPAAFDASGVENAISDDGSRVFWTAYSGDLGEEGSEEGRSGKLYVRLNPDQEQSKISGGGKCTEPEKACTIAVSGSVSPEAAQFWFASENGSRGIFEIVTGALSGNLYEFDVDTKTSRLIASGVLGPMGASQDLSRVYFASTEDLAPGASEGARNLYLYEADEGGGEGSFHFIMRMVGEDFTRALDEPAAINQELSNRSSTVSPDGRHALFTSAASPTPTGYDNADAASGAADLEVYRYEAEDHKLLCVSCNPTGARPSGENAGSSARPFWEAAQLRKQRVALHAPRTLADDGSRVFFESHEALVPRDSNGTWDVYEWELVGTGSCEEADSTYSEASEGCIDLISSGQSSTASRFLDADPTGKNVFIGTQSSLIPADYGLSDVYDARVGGGLPEPSPPPAACEGEACQGPLATPNHPTPASSALAGDGNVSAATPKPRCVKPRVRRKGRCAAKHHKRAKHQRRAGR